MPRIIFPMMIPNIDYNSYADVTPYCIGKILEVEDTH